MISYPQAEEIHGHVFRSEKAIQELECEHWSTESNTRTKALLRALSQVSSMPHTMQALLPASPVQMTACVVRVCSMCVLRCHASQAQGWLCLRGSANSAKSRAGLGESPSDLGSWTALA